MPFRCWGGGGGKFEFRGRLLIRCHQITEQLCDIHILGTGTYMCVFVCTVVRDSQLMFQQSAVFHGLASLSYLPWIIKTP